MRLKSHSPLTGDAWMQQQLATLKMLATVGPTMTTEKAAALLDMLGGDRALFEQLVVTTKATRQPDLIADISAWLTAGGDPRCR